MTMKTKKILSSLLILIFFSGCALITDEYQANQRKVFAYLLEEVSKPMITSQIFSLLIIYLYNLDDFCYHQALALKL